MRTQLDFLYYNTRQHAVYTLLLCTRKVSGFWEIITRHLRCTYVRKREPSASGTLPQTPLISGRLGGHVVCSRCQQKRIQINLSRVGLFDNVKTSFYVDELPRQLRGALRAHTSGSRDDERVYNIRATRSEPHTSKTRPLNSPLSSVYSVTSNTHAHTHFHVDVCQAFHYEKKCDML